MDNGMDIIVIFLFLFLFYFCFILADSRSSIRYPIKKIGLTNVHIDNADRRSYLPNLESKNEVAS